MPLERRCLACRTPIGESGKRGGRPKLYCNDACRQRRYYSANRERIKLRRLARAEPRERGCTVEEVLAQWGEA